MKEEKEAYRKIVESVPEHLKIQVNTAFDISDRIAELMEGRNLTKKQLADALGKRPSEVTKWLSGQHNFTIATISKLSAFFHQPIITVAND